MNKKVLALTGASSGIGASFLRKSSDNFQTVYTFGRQKPDDSSGKIAHQHLDLRANVRPQLNEEKLPYEIDVLALCAGSDVKGRNDFLSADFKTWEDTIMVNYLRTVELIHLLLPRVLRSPTKTLIAVTSTNIDSPASKCLAYTSAKTALRSVLDNLRLEYSSVGLRVIEICPSITKTNFAFHRTNDAHVAEQFYSSFSSVLQPEEIADSMLWAIQQAIPTTITRLEVQPTILSR